ncbi:hypothetical protein FACS1894142_6770 [Spirochaetia bacterium]|nr:hypothetical protein FACS1894142_6770 [Spirochaetia bacterium]
MKTGVSSYSFSRLFKNPGYTLFNVIEDAKKIGFDTHLGGVFRQVPYASGNLLNDVMIAAVSG